MKCPECGREFFEGKFCPDCGTLVNSDYVRQNQSNSSSISEEIKRQMREQMETDENVYYWLEEEMEDWNFKTITEETSFYLNEEENLVISFNEAEVAPAYMGVVEFVIEKEAVGDILKK